MYRQTSISALALLFGLLLAPCSFGQDPFGATPAKSSSVPSTLSQQKTDSSGRPILDELDDSTKLIVESVRNAKLDTPSKLADAVRTMMDLEEFAEAKFYLGELEKQNLDNATLFDLNRIVGPAFFFRLNQSEEMSPIGQRFALKVIAASERVAQSPIRIEELIAKLSSNNNSDMATAFVDLRSVGEVAIAQMISTFADESKSNQFDGIRSALFQMGEVATKPLIAGATSGNEKVQVESILALAQINNPDAFDAVLAAYFSQNSSDKVRTAAATAIVDSYGAIPSAEEASIEWKKQADYLLDDSDEIIARRLGIESTKRNIWRWVDQNNRLETVLLDRIAANRVQAARLGKLLYQLKPKSEDAETFYLLTALDAEKHLVGSLAPIDAKSFLADHSELDASQLGKLLKLALHRKMVPAAIACCELLGELGDASVLHSGSHQPGPVVQAVLFGDQHLQYAAIAAIDRMAPTQKFAGSSYVAEAAVYMADFAEQPAILVGNSREDFARTLASTLSQSGYGGVTAGDGREFYRKATTNANLQYLMICDTFHHPDYAELTQQLRQDWRTKNMPIAILYRSENEKRAKRIADRDELTLAMPFTVNQQLVALQVQQLEQYSTVWPLTIDHRRLYSQSAITWLAKVTNRDDDKSVFDFSSYEGQLAKLLFTRGWENETSQILANLGTRNSQRILVNFASETGLPLDARESAVRAFKDSLGRNGILLTRDEVLKQYDRYNDSERDTKGSQAVFGSILDAIEENAGSNPK